MSTTSTRPRTRVRRLAAVATLSVAMLATGVAADAAPAAKPTAKTAGWAYTGATANVWGAVPGSSGAEVWTEVRLSDGRWSRSQTRQTKSGGQYAIPLTYNTTTPGTQRWRVSARSSNGTIVHSDAFTFTRRTGVSAKTATVAAVGARSNVWGAVPGGAGARVWTQALVGGRWSTSQVGTANKSGAYALPLTYGARTRGTQQFRVQARTTDGRMTTSQTVRLRRVNRPTMATAGSAPAGRKANAWGTVDGAAGAQVWTEVQLAKGSWSRSQVGRVSSAGRYTLPLTYGAANPGTYRFRVGVRYPGGVVVYSNAATFRRTDARYNLDSRCFTGARVMCASKSARKLYYVRNGKVAYVLDARFGAASYPTREGVHHVFWKSRHHVSSIYGTAMPWAMFFNGGQAVHYSDNFRRVGWDHPGSGGCINIRDAKTLDRIYREVRNGDKVVVHRGLSRR